MIENTLQDILTELRNIHHTLCAAEARDNPLQASLPLENQAAMPTPTAVFGNAASFTAAAGLLPTAPEVSTVTSPPPANVPVPPAATAVPPVTTVVPPTANPAGGVDLDKSGLPWDGRIHATSKAKVADGHWRARRGVDPALVKQVENELRQTMAAPAAPGAGWTPTPVAIPEPPVAVPEPPVAVPEPPGAPQNPLAAVPWPIPAPDAVPVATYAELTTLVTSALTQGTLTFDQINAACMQYGVPAFPALANRPDLVPAIKQALGL